MENCKLENVSNEEILSIYELAKLHDLAHVVAEWCFKNSVMPTNHVFIQKQVHAFQRSEQMKNVILNVSNVFEEEKIAFIPLKGSVLRDYYPNPAMRTSCDIDILIKKSDLKRAEKVLIQKLGYSPFHRDTHDIAFTSPDNVNLELHFDLIEKNVVGSAEKPLTKVWDSVILKENSKYHYLLSDELFYYYHIAHMAKHFLLGGSGIRSIMDVWVLNNKVSFDKEKRDSLLKKGGLLTFANKMEELSEIWFGTNKNSEGFETIESFLIFGGTYGNIQNQAVIKSQKKSNKLSYLLSRIWVPYDTLKFEYPSLNGRRYLTLFYQIKRWFKFIFLGKKRREQEKEINSVVTNTNSQKAREMLDFLGLE
jgi:hypothetical protein